MKRRWDATVTTGLLRQLAAKGRVFRFVAHGVSMRPAIAPGSVVLVRPLGGKEPTAGAVVMAITAQGEVVVHRLVRVDERLLLWGDNMPKPDGALEDFEVLGEVVDVETPTILRAVGFFFQRAQAFAGRRLQHVTRGLFHSRAARRLLGCTRGRGPRSWPPR